MQKRKICACYIILAIALAVAIPIRTYLVMFKIDPSTGFYTGGNQNATVLNVLLLAATIALILPFFLFRDLRGFQAKSWKSVPMAALTGLLSLALFFGAAEEFYKVMSFTGGAGAFIDSLTQALAAVSFIFLALGFAGRYLKRMPGIALLPVIWSAVNLMVSWMHYTSVVNVSEYLYDMLKMVCVMIFFYYNARYAGMVSNKKEIVGMLAFGLPAVLFSLVSIVPRYIALFSGIKVAADTINDLCFLLISVYIIATISGIFLTGKSRDVKTIGEIKE